MAAILRQFRAAGFAKLLGAGLLSLAHAVLTGMTGNAAFPKPFVDLSVLKAGIDSYAASLAAALDRGKKALQERNAQRVALIRTLLALASYVEMNSNNDLTTFMSSGFKPVSRSRAAAQPLPPASIVRLDSGVISGQIRAVVKPLPKARTYDLRYALAQAAPSPDPWTLITFRAARKAPPITGLTPGATYTFQVRALGTLGSTDWSDPVTGICT